MTAYDAAFRHLLTRLDAEQAHHLAARAIGAAGTARIVRRTSSPPASLAVETLGTRFTSPLGVAAGFDKDARMIDGLGALGFASVEVGTVTALAQPGNPRPRLVRLPADRAIVNRMGFNNSGAAAVAVRLAGRLAGLAGRQHRHGTGADSGAGPVLGVNLGKTKLTAPGAAAAADYAHSARLLSPYADYLVVNVSSPNTPGLRDLQATAALRPILEAVLDAARTAVPTRTVPLLVKIAPDLATEDIDDIADLVLEQGLDGVIATNTTTSRAGLASSPRAVAAAGPGGLSGAPLRERSLQVLRRLRLRLGTCATLVSAGGVATAEDVWTRMRAGATLVQAYTGFVYGGPCWPSRIHRELAARTHRSGLQSIADVVGSDAEGIEHA